MLAYNVILMHGALGWTMCSHFILTILSDRHGEHYMNVEMRTGC